MRLNIFSNTLIYLNKMHHKYHPVKIHKLSHHQMSRLRNGHPTRLKFGPHHTVHLSEHQIKQMEQAHRRGQAKQITFDPYQAELHKGGKLGNIISNAKQVYSHAKENKLLKPTIEYLEEEFKGAGRHRSMSRKRSVSKGGNVFGKLGRVIGHHVIDALPVPGLARTVGHFAVDKVGDLVGAGRRKAGRPRKHHRSMSRVRSVSVGAGKLRKHKRKGSKHIKFGVGLHAAGY
jgi:hypothetical protein